MNFNFDKTFLKVCMIINNYSKCPIHYFINVEKDLPRCNLQFVLDYKCSAPDYSGITRGVYDLDTDTLYWQYDNTKFNITKALLLGSRKSIIEAVRDSLHSKIVVEGINRKVY